MKKLVKNWAAVLSISLLGAGSAMAAGLPKPAMIQLKPGVYQYNHAFYNSLVVIGEQGVLVTDPSGAERAAAMRKAIAELTDLPVTQVVYSHDHFDHSRGGKIFKDEGATFITHQGCVELLERDLEQQVVAADITYQDNYRVELGSKQVDLHYYGSNDGKCMSIIHMPTDKVLVGVDWHLPGVVNEVYRLNEHDYVGTLNTLKRVRAELDYDTVISGHAPKSSPAMLEEDYRFVQALFDAVWQGMQQGESVEQLKQSVQLPEFSHWYGYKKNLPGHVERMAYSIWHGN